MAENTNNIVTQYVITRYEDGAIDVRNSDAENVINKLNTEEIYNDVCDVAKIIDRKRAENAAYVGAKMAIIDFYASLQNMGTAAPEANPGEGLSI